MVTVIRGKAYTIEQMIYGDEKEQIEPNKKFIEEIEKHHDLKDMLLKNGSLVKGRSQHASGLLITPEPYWVHNAMMKTKKGIRVTQFDAGDSEACSAVKVDTLTVNFLDRMRTCLNILIKEEKIKWEGDLKTTWNKNFHPKVLDITSPEIFKPLYELSMSNAFQFTSAIGMNALLTLKASTFADVYNGNSLMRLQEVDGKNPLLRYVEFKNSPELWEKEMVDYGLTEEERKIMHELFDEDNGVMSSQEKLMFSVMRICNYTVAEANALRKSISKKNPEKQKKEKEKLYDRALSIGRRKELIDYFWDYEIAFSLGYSFSIPHTIAYTYILFQGLNMFVKYGKQYWDLANLLNDSGLVGETENNTNYDKLVSAIGKLDNILPCDINKSSMDFKVEGENIRYGFRAVSGIDKDNIPVILDNAPYTSFEDFYDRIYKTKKLSEKKIITLIKTGSFDCFEKDRRKLMIKFVEMAYPVKKITMTQFNNIRDCIEGYETEKQLFDFRSKIIGKNKVKMNKEIEKEFLVNYADDVEFEVGDKGLKINEKSFENYYKKRIKPLQERINQEDIQMAHATMKRRGVWSENCMGNVSSWEMEVYFSYFSKHELDLMPINEYFTLENYTEMSETPEISGYYTRVIDGERVQFPTYKINRIGGTVIAKDNNRGYVYLLTQHGVVNVKYNKGQYGYYTSIQGGDGSWFDRGAILVITGYRRGNDFIAKAPKGGSSTTKIISYNNKTIRLLTQKKEN